MPLGGQEHDSIATMTIRQPLVKLAEPRAIRKLAAKLVILGVCVAIFLFHPLAVNLGLAGPVDGGDCESG